MSNEATSWALRQTTGHTFSKLLLYVLADAADWQNQAPANLEYLERITEMPARSLQHHLKALQSQGLITPLFGPLDAHGLAPLVGYQLAFSPPRPHPTAQPRKSRQRRSDGPQEVQKEAIRDAESAEPAAPPVTVVPGSLAWWATFWRNVMDGEPTSYMVTEGEQGHPWPITAHPSNPAKAALVELSEDEAAAWEVWLAGKDARFPIHDLIGNPGKVFGPHHWPRELV